MRPVLQTRAAGGAATGALGPRRAALTAHEDTGRVGLDLSMGLGVERRLPPPAGAELIARASGAREEPEADEADEDEQEDERIHQRRVSAVARSDRAIA